MVKNCYLVDHSNHNSIILHNFCDSDVAVASIKKGYSGRNCMVQAKKEFGGASAPNIKHAQGNGLNHQNYKKPSGNGPPSIGNGH
jgi:hypothetical protein